MITFYSPRIRSSLQGNQPIQNNNQFFPNPLNESQRNLQTQPQNINPYTQNTQYPQQVLQNNPQRNSSSRSTSPNFYRPKPGFSQLKQSFTPVLTQSSQFMQYPLASQTIQQQQIPQVKTSNSQTRNSQLISLPSPQVISPRLTSVSSRSQSKAVKNPTPETPQQNTQNTIFQVVDLRQYEERWQKKFDEMENQIIQLQNQLYQEQIIEPRFGGFGDQDSINDQINLIEENQELKKLLATAQSCAKAKENASELYEQEIISLQTLLNEKDSLNAQLNRQVNFLKKFQVQQIRDLQEKQKQYQNDLNEQIKSYEKLESDYKASQNANKILQDEANQKFKELNQIQDKVKELGLEESQKIISKIKKNLTMRLDTVQSELDYQKTSYDSRSEQFKEIYDKFNNMTNDNKVLRDNSTNQEKKIQDQNRIIAQLEIDLKDIKKKNNDLQKESQTLKQELEQIKSKNSVKSLQDNISVQQIGSNNNIKIPQLNANNNQKLLQQQELDKIMASIPEQYRK